MSKTEQKLLTPGPLLDRKGDPAEAGYATSLVREYAREDIKAPGWRIKEWDYYYIGCGDTGVCLTVADNSYMAMLSVSVLDFVRRSYITRSRMKFFTGGKLALPASSVSGTTAGSFGGCSIRFTAKDGVRHLVAEMPEFGENKEPFSCEFTLTDEPRDSMVIVTPFDKPKHFYYNQKINAMRAVGHYTIGDRTVTTDDGLGTLDWGRGVWTYRNEWYWASLSARLPDGRTVGYNLGYGFGNTSAASENMLFCDGIAHKLGHVHFDIPKKADGTDDFLSHWHVTDSDGRVDLRMEPLLDRKDHTSAVIISSDQHQVFGRIYGSIMLDSGEILTLDGPVGFAEKVRNRW